MSGVITSTIEPSASNRYTYYDYLHYIPIEQKDKLWAAQVLYFNKTVSYKLVDSETIAKFRDKDKGKIDKQALIDIIDPKMPDGTGGTADYFSADWKGNPIYLHLRRIQKAKLDQLPISHQVRAADEYAQTTRQKENSKMLGRKMFIEFVNSINKELGIPQLRPDEDPFKYAEKLAAGQGAASQTGSKKGMVQNADRTTSIIDSIKASIDDNEGISLYNTYIHKDGAEIAIELGIEYYLTTNKFQILREQILSDLINFNRYAFRWYTSKTTGEPVIEVLDLNDVKVSKFKKLDGSDHTHWYIEYNITFGDFVRMFGANRSEQELRDIFELNRHNGYGSTGHGLQWDRCSSLQRDGALIRIGYTEWETQNMEVYGEGYFRGNFRYNKMDSKWIPPKESPYTDSKREERHYNCWYKMYYIPIHGMGSSDVASTSFEDQAKYIYDFGPLQDQVRDGEDKQYSKSSLILWKSEEPSWAEIEDRFMGKIDLLWQQFQNDLANAMPHGQWFNEEIITESLQLLDEGQREGKDNITEVIRKLKQTGYGWGKMFTKDGKPIPPFTEIKTGHLASAMERLTMIFQIYQLLMQCLGKNDISSGQAPKPRQALGGIEKALEASDDSTYYIQKAFIDGYTELGKRMLYYFKEIVAEKNSRRLQEFRDIVGMAQSYALEAIDGIPLRNLGLTVDMANTQEANAFLNQFALEASTAPNGLMDPVDALELTFINNVKYKYAILRLKAKQRRKQMMEERENERNYQMQLLNAQNQIEQNKLQTTFQNQLKVMEVENRLDAKLLEFETRLKTMSQLEQKDKIKDNRIEQEVAVNQIKTNAEQQAPLI